MLYEVITGLAELLAGFGLADGLLRSADQLNAQAREGLEVRLEEQVYAPDMDEVAREAAAKPVITSYSIHYTKLYDPWILLVGAFAILIVVGVAVS